MPASILYAEYKAFSIKLIRLTKVFFWLLGFNLVSGVVNAQLDNSSFTWQTQISEADSGNLSVQLRALGFSRNNEYFNTFADGYTLFGYQVQPGLLWQPGERVVFEAGLYARKDFGTYDYTTLQPTFQIQAKFDSLKLIFGTLEGSINHRLIEPMYDFERVMLDRLEEGVQVIYNKEKLWADLWIDWENMIYPGDPTQEVVSGGASLRFNIRNKEKSSLWLPAQFIAYHKGGQIDTSPDPLITRINWAVGLDYEKEVGRKFLHSWRFQPYFVGYRDASTTLKQRFKDGYGLYLNASADTKLGTLMLSYWRGNEFVPIKGAPLFSSYSLTFDNPGAVSQERNIVMFRLLQDLPVGNNLHVILRLEPFYDFEEGRADFSNSIYLSYRQEIDF